MQIDCCFLWSGLTHAVVWRYASPVLVEIYNSLGRALHMDCHTMQNITLTHNLSGLHNWPIMRGRICSTAHYAQRWMQNTTNLLAHYHKRDNLLPPGLA